MIIILIPPIIIGAISTYTAKNAVEKLFASGIEENLKTLNSTLNSTLEMKIHDMDVMAKEINAQLIRGEDSPQLRGKLTQYAELHPEAQSIFVATPAGLFIEEPKVIFDPDYDPRERDWYKQAMENKGEVIISKPYKFEGSDEMVVTIARTMEDGSGVVAVDLRLSHLQELATQISVGEEGYAFILDQDKHIIAHPELQIGSEVQDSNFDKMYANDAGSFYYTYAGDQKAMVYTTNELTGWKLGGNVYVSEVDERAFPILKTTIAVMIFSFLIGAILAFFIIKSIIKRLRVLKEKAEVISKGDLTEDIEVNSTDEIGKLGEAFNEMQESLKKLVQEVDRHAEQVAAASEQLTASADQTASAAEEVSASVQDVAQGAEKQTTKLEENAQAIKKATEATTLIADKSTKVAELSNQAKIQAESGGVTLDETVAQMNSIKNSVMESNAKIQTLRDRSNEVKTIIDVISNIADQTNLLSLNAAIEAARAGEHGKGFSVVADEVRDLAQESQSSAKKIAEIISGIQHDTELSVKSMERVMEDVQKGVKISNEAIEKFDEILRHTNEISQQIDEISTTVQKISDFLQGVTDNVDEILTIAQGNAAASEEVAASSEEQTASMQEITASAKMLANLAEELKQLLSQFKYDAEK